MSVGGPQLCVGAIAVDGANLLMIRRGTVPGVGRWSLPGGRIEAGESVVSAVVRELREETGLEGVCGAFTGWVERFGTDHHHVILNFQAAVLDATEPVAGDDASAARWVPLADVGKLDLVDGLEVFLTDHGVLGTEGALGIS